MKNARGNARNTGMTSKTKNKVNIISKSSILINLVVSIWKKSKIDCSNILKWQQIVLAVIIKKRLPNLIAFLL
jgi:hypothetical protein